jgi:hypothetical protein
MEKKKFTAVRMTLTRDQISGFVADLHRIHEDMINTVMYNKERQGFPEATEVINYIKSLK